MDSSPVILKTCGHTVISTPAKAGGEIFFSVIKDFSVTSFLRNDAAISATKY